MTGTILERFHATGMSIKRLLDLSGVPYNSCHGLVNGVRSVTLDTADKLCRVLDLELRKRKG